MVLKNKQRIFLSVFFLMSGFGFSSWASRIPTLKSAFGFNEAELGTLLLAMPVSSLAGLPISGWLVSRFDSRIPLSAAFVLNAVALACIGFAHNTLMLVVALCVFSFSTRIFNISVNTQTITLQKQFDKRIIGSFHGLWSTGGILGVSFTTLMIAFDVPMSIHLATVAAAALLLTAISYRHLLRNDRAATGNRLVLGKPDPYIFYLGILIFFAAICEGGMFDWSGIYFQEVIKAEIFTYGYLIFMTFMATSRFLSDLIIHRIGMRATYIMSAAFIITGIGIAVLFTNFWAALAGFSIVGFGTAAVIPMTYALAGSSKKYSPGMALSIISSYSIAGMLLGPPLIGYLAHAFNLRISFMIFILCGIMIIPISHLFFKHKRMLK